jgi:hypothetical protein
MCPYRKIREEQDRIITEKHAIIELEIQQKQKEDDFFIENQRAVQKVISVAFIICVVVFLYLCLIGCIIRFTCRECIF